MISTFASTIGRPCESFTLIESPDAFACAERVRGKNSRRHEKIAAAFRRDLRSLRRTIASNAATAGAIMRGCERVVDLQEETTACTWVLRKLRDSRTTTKARSAASR